MSSSRRNAVLDAPIGRRTFLYGAGAVAATGLLAACGGSNKGSGGGKGAINIGYVAALTGPVAAYGTQTFNALKLAAKDVNALGGIMGRQVNIKALDNQSKPDTVPALMRQLKSDGCNVLFGASASPPTIVAAQTADQLRVPLIVPMEAAAAIIGDGRKYVFKVAPSTLAENGWPAQSVRAAMAAAEKSGTPAKTALIIHASTGAYPEAKEAWERTLKAEFPNVKILGIISFDEVSTSDYAPLVSRAQSAAPDLLFFGGNPQSAFQFYPALLRSRFKPKATIGLLGGNTNTKFIESVGVAAAEGDIAGNYWTYKLAGKSTSKFSPQKFYDDYQAANGGQKPDGVGAYYYACMGLVADAITAAGTADDSEKIAQALRDIDISGPSEDSNGMFIVGHGVKFNDKGLNTRAEGLVTQIQKGVYVPVYPEAVATGQIIYPRSK